MTAPELSKRNTWAKYPYGEPGMGCWAITNGHMTFVTGYRLIEPGNNLSFDADELRVIDTALRHAIQDVEDYIKSGDADRDFTDQIELAEYKQLPDQWLELRKRILQHQVGQV